MTDALSKRSAFVKAQKRWGEFALHSRGELRRVYGVRGDLRALDEAASGRRGVAVPRGLAAMAIELHGAGMPKDQILARLHDAITQIVAMACQQDGAA